MTIGERIKQARKAKGLTQKQLGEVSGTSEITVRQYEIGKRQPRLEQLRQIALALGTSVSELVEPGYWGNLSQEERDGMWDTGHAAIAAPQQRISAALGKLNDDGMEKAADVVEIIAEVPRYQAAPQHPVPAPEGKDTTPPPEGAERPPEGE